MPAKPSKPPVSPARLAAFEILRRVESERAYASVLLAAVADSDISRGDRALAQEITLGVLRWQKLLDCLIEGYSGRATKDLDLPVLLVLRIGLYQIRFLTRIPNAAAVNESVNLVKTARRASAAGLVNAVLRRAARHPDDKPGEQILEPLERASVELSHPRWLLEKWQCDLGMDEARALALSCNQPAQIAFRVNTLKTNVDEALALLRREGLTIRESEFVTGAFVIESGSAAAVVDAAEQGLVYLQDEASQLVSLLLEPEPGQCILDLCAAPGSKSSQLAALTGNRAWILACDLHPRRLKTLMKACARLGVTSVDAAAADATVQLPLVEATLFDRVLVDAPCSGTGTLRQNPEIKWRLAADDIARLADVQLSLLERAAAVVRAGGQLVYSTCSIEPEENEAVLGRFLRGARQFAIARPRAHPALTTPEGFVRTYPHRHGTDGFFAAVLVRQG